MHNLPLQLTSFIGREEQMAEVEQLLAARRLVTLTGAGGSGKTRLGLQVAAEVLEAFADGVFFVNIRFMFNGDRMVLGKAYNRRQEHGGQKPLPLFQQGLAAPTIDNDGGNA